MKGDLSAVISMVYLISMLTYVFNVQPVKADESITVIRIKADGSIEPSNVPILRSGNIYTFSSNITNAFIKVERDNVTIDGAGYALQGVGAPQDLETLLNMMELMGVELYNRKNVTIKNMIIKNSGYGITLDHSSNITISRCSITNIFYISVYLFHSSNNLISENNITGSFILSTSSNNTIIRNSVTGTYIFPLTLGYFSNNNIISENAFIKNGLFIYDSYKNLVRDNVVNGKPLVYLENVSDFTVGDAGQVILVKCKRIKVKGLDLSNTGTGVELWETNETEIIGNNIVNNMDYGVYLYRSFYNSIDGNNIVNNEEGICLDDSSNNTIIRNIVANNYEYGINLRWSFYNVIYHNNFTNNKHQASVGELYPNVWDNGYPSGGNCWSDYKGLDEKNGPRQDQLGSDGIGDEPYVINDYNRDNYPLMRHTDRIPPSVSNLAFSNPVWGGLVVSCLVLDEVSGVREVNLYYSTDSGESWVKIAMTLRENIYAGSIPQQMPFTEIRYYVEAIDNAGNKFRTMVESYTVGIPVWLYITVLSAVILLFISVLLRRKGKLFNAR